MVEAATGGACDRSRDAQYSASPPIYREQLPILFRLPRLSDPVLECYDLSTDLQYPPMMLGLGDVVLPGLLIGFCFGIDYVWKVRWNMYGVTSVISYACGMVMTMAALVLMKQAQPALIYLIPCTIIPIYILALIRREFCILWHGILPSSEEQLQVRPGDGEAGTTYRSLSQDSRNSSTIQ